MKRYFQNRFHAGQCLVPVLMDYAHRDDVVVLALPRGGVPVAYEIARALQVPLDVWLVRKLGVPSHPELAMGAIAPGGIRILNDDVLKSHVISDEAFNAVLTHEQAELERRDRTYRGNRPPRELQGKTVILVDDGIATGSTLRAAIAALKHYGPHQIIVAVPIAPPNICQFLRTEVDRVICLLEPEQLSSISLWYDDFSQTSDEQVMDLLNLSQTQNHPTTTTINLVTLS